MCMKEVLNFENSCVTPMLQVHWFLIKLNKLIIPNYVFKNIVFAFWVRGYKSCQNLIISCSKSWKAFAWIKVTNVDIVTSCKKNYTRLLSLRSKPPPTCERRLLNFGYQKDDLRKVYLLLFLTKEVRLSMFQNKIIHNILCTKSLLFWKALGPQHSLEGTSGYTATERLSL